MSYEIQADLKNNFSAISVAIIDVLNFIKNLKRNTCNFNIPYYAPIIILVAYRYARGREVWNGKSETIKRFLFTAFLCDGFANSTQKLIKDLLAYVSNKRNSFLLPSIKRIFTNNKRDFSVNLDEILDTRINGNRSNLILYLVYKDKEGFNAASMTAHDHIFPRAILRALRRGNRQLYSQNQYDSILNCELLTPAENQAKSAALPENYFAGIHNFEQYSKLHAIPRDNNLWKLENYLKFLEARKTILAERIKNNL